MIKKIILISTLVSLSFASDIYNTFPTDKEAYAFKKGFQLAIMSIKDGREYKLQGKDEAEVEFKDYIVFIDSTDMDDSDKMAVQKIGFIYAESVRLNDNRIAIANFSSKANAVTLAKTLNKTYFNKNAPHRKAYVYTKKKNDTFYREKSLASEIANLLEEELKDQMEVIYIKDKQNRNNNRSIEKSIPMIKKNVERPNKELSESTTEKIKEIPIKQKNFEKEKEPKKIVAVKKSFTNNEPFLIQFMPKGKYITRYKLIKNIDEENISSIDLIKQSQIENGGELLLSDAYLITIDEEKFIKAQNGFYYLEKEIEVIEDFVKAQK